MVGSPAPRTCVVDIRGDFNEVFATSAVMSLRKEGRPEPSSRMGTTLDPGQEQRIRKNVEPRYFMPNLNRTKLTPTGGTVGVMAWGSPGVAADQRWRAAPEVAADVECGRAPLGIALPGSRVASSISFEASRSRAALRYRDRISAKSMIVRSGEGSQEYNASSTIVVFASRDVTYDNLEPGRRSWRAVSKKGPP